MDAIIALFVVTPSWRQSPWLNNLWHSGTKNYYSAIKKTKLNLNQLTWRAFHEVLLNEKRKMQKCVYNTISFL